MLYACLFIAAQTKGGAICSSNGRNGRNGRNVRGVALFRLVFFLIKLNKPREELFAAVTDVTFVVLPAWLHADPMPALVVNC